MALDEPNGIPATMLVGPTGYGGGYGNNGGFFGNGDLSWLILLLLCGWGGGFGMGGWGMGGMMWPMMMGAGMGGFGLDYLYPWLNNSQHISDGFRDQNLQTSIAGLQNSVTSGFGDVQLGIAGVNQAICQTGNGITAAVTAAQNGITQQLYSNELASLNRSFAEQTANTHGFTGVNSGLADLRYVVATEACADRAAVSDALRDVISANTASTQRILDQLCADKIEAKNDTIAQLRSELLYARGQASQDVQTARVLAGQATTANQLVSELRSCPIPAQPVYGNQPIFQCSGPTWNNNGCGCGNNGFGFNG